MYHTRCIGPGKLLLLLKCGVSANIMSEQSASKLNLYKTSLSMDPFTAATMAHSQDILLSKPKYHLFVWRPTKGQIASPH